MKWDEILTAKEASLKLGKNEKYIYFLYKQKSNLLKPGTVALKGNTLLISKEGIEHLEKILKKKSELTMCV